MFIAALDALARDPSIGFIGFDAFPPRGEDDAVWAEPVLDKARKLQKETGVAFASVAMSPLAYSSRAKEFVRAAKLPFIQGHHAATGAIRALIELQSRGKGARAQEKSSESRAKALKVVRGHSGPLDESRAAELLSLYGVKRPKERMVATPVEAAKTAERIGYPVAVKAAAAELPHKAKLGGVRLGLSSAAEVEDAAEEVLHAATKAGAAKPKVLVQQMVTGTEVLLGAVIDERFGPAITIRPGGALAEAGEAVFVAAPLTSKEAYRYVSDQSARSGLDAERHDLKAVAKAVKAIGQAAWDLRARLSSLEANPLVVLSDGAVAVDALAEARARE
jgi:acyl-CoA synthetase (NDP forming)